MTYHSEHDDPVFFVHECQDCKGMVDKSRAQETLANHITIKNDAIAEVTRCHAEIERLQAEILKYSKVIEDRGFGFQDAINKALIERDLWKHKAEALGAEKAGDTSESLKVITAKAEKMAEALRGFANHQDCKWDLSRACLPCKALFEYEGHK